MTNATLPGNPRYQPKSLELYVGYDNLARPLVEVELAALRTLGDLGRIPAQDLDLLTPDVELNLVTISMSAVDKIEREVTKHDIRALVRLMQDAMPEPLRRWVHVPLTSYDVIDTARSLLFLRMHKEVVWPKARAVLQSFVVQADRYARDVQAGRTHGQHALPITVGFWFATILGRLITNLGEMDRHANNLVGKISGAVGAYNAQAGLKIATGLENESFEALVLKRLGLKPAPISTQILPPEPLAYYLFSCLMLSATFGQFGRDGRNLSRTELAEVSEPFEKGQVGSSTMAQKRNPMTFENLEGMWLRTKAEFGKVLDTMISDHQRDLVGSSPARDFPIIIVNLVQQLESLLRPGKEDPRPFIQRIVVNLEKCRQNLALQGDLVLAEPLYLALQLHGYAGDAHELINHQAVPLVGEEAASLYDAVEHLAESDAELRTAWEAIPKDMHKFLQDPTQYVGFAYEKIMEICTTTEDIFKLPR